MLTKKTEKCIIREKRTKYKENILKFKEKENELVTCALNGR